MQPADVLPTIAEISITLAGFTGVLVAIRSASGSMTSTDQSVRIGVVLIVPAIVLICSLLPFVLSDFSAAPRIVWGVPLCVFGFASMFMVCLTAYRVLSGTVQLTTPRVSWTLMMIGFVVYLLVLLSGLGQLLPFSAGVLVFGLTWSLLGAAVSLVAAVSVGVRPPDV